MIDKATFCRKYVPMAKAGKSALEIGKALGVDTFKDTDTKVSQFVSQKASIYRKELKLAAEAVAKKEGLSDEDAATKVRETMAKLPKLQTRTRVVVDFAAFLDGLIADCDTPQEEGDTPEDKEDTPE